MSDKSNPMKRIDQQSKSVQNSESNEPRGDYLRLEEHLISASRLSLVMTLALDSAVAKDDGFQEDERQGLYELSHEIARHAAAALKVHEERYPPC